MASAPAAAAPRFAARKPAALRGSWLPLGSFVREVLLPFLVSRALLLGCALGALNQFPLHAGDGVWTDEAVAPWIAAFSRWDGRWYLSVAQHGYSYQPGQAANVAFSPLYPWL